MFEMLGNILKNLGSKPSTRLYPYEKRQPYKNTRGQVCDVDIDSCIFCGICARKCPADALKVDRNEKSWEIDRFNCVVCGVCSEVCPKKCLNMDENHKTPAFKKSTSKLVQQPKAQQSEKTDQQ